METIIHADIFFFIATIAVIAVSVLVAVILCYVTRIMRNMKDISDDMKDIADRAKIESGAILDDVSEFRSEMKHDVRSGKEFFQNFLSTIIKRFKGRGHSKRKR